MKSWPHSSTNSERPQVVDISGAKHVYGALHALSVASMVAEVKNWSDQWRCMYVDSPQQQQQQPRVMRCRLYKLGWPCPGWRIAPSSPSLFCSLHRVRQPGTHAVAASATDEHSLRRVRMYIRPSLNYVESICVRHLREYGCCGRCRLSLRITHSSGALRNLI